MSPIPLRCVIDTNVAMTANGSNAGVTQCCVAASARALYEIYRSGHVFIDTDREIVREYGNNLSDTGQPGPGDLFYRWLLTNLYNEQRVSQITITPSKEDPEGYEELPDPPPCVRYDPSDKKFLAVAAAATEHPPILQSFDSKWWGWQEALARIGVTIHFLCPEEIEAKYNEKMKL